MWEWEENMSSSIPHPPVQLVHAKVLPPFLAAFIVPQSCPNLWWLLCLVAVSPTSAALKNPVVFLACLERVLVGLC